MMSLYEVPLQSQRQHERKLLLCARDLIKNHKERFVCLALAAALDEVARNPATCQIPRMWLVSARRRLVSWVIAMLGDNAYYEGWLDRNHAGLRHSVPKGNRKAYALEARLRWIDWMVEQIDKELETLND